MIYIQAESGLTQVSPSLTKEKIIAALGYTPADNATFYEDESGALVIADEQGYVIARIDADGLATTKISVGSIIDDSNELIICDPEGNVIMKVDANGLNVTNLYLNNSKVNLTNSLSGKKLSILGASISSYEGYLPDGYATYYPAGDVTSVDSTWWKKLIDNNNMVLGQNASYSGAPIQSDGDVLGHCSDERIAALANNGTPDIIIIQGGINDGKIEDLAALGEINTVIDLPFTSESAAAYDDTTFLGAYQAMLTKLMVAYPNARIACFSMTWTSRPDVITSDDLNMASNKIEELCKLYGCEFIDLRKCGINPANMSTYLGAGDDTMTHPKVAGMELIANYVEKCLK